MHRSSRPTTTCVPASGARDADAGTGATRPSAAARGAASAAAAVGRETRGQLGAVPQDGADRVVDGVARGDVGDEAGTVRRDRPHGRSRPTGDDRQAVGEEPPVGGGQLHTHLERVGAGQEADGAAGQACVQPGVRFLVTPVESRLDTGVACRLPQSTHPGGALALEDDERDVGQVGQQLDHLAKSLDGSRQMGVEDDERELGLGQLVQGRVGVATGPSRLRRQGLLDQCERCSWSEAAPGSPFALRRAHDEQVAGVRQPALGAGPLSRALEPRDGSEGLGDGQVSADVVHESGAGAARHGGHSRRQRLVADHPQHVDTVQQGVEPAPPLELEARLGRQLDHLARGRGPVPEARLQTLAPAGVEGCAGRATCRPDASGKVPRGRRRLTARVELELPRGEQRLLLVRVAQASGHRVVGAWQGWQPGGDQRLGPRPAQHADGTEA